MCSRDFGWRKSENLTDCAVAIVRGHGFTGWNLQYPGEGLVQQRLPQRLQRRGISFRLLLVFLPTTRRVLPSCLPLHLPDDADHKLLRIPRDERPHQQQRISSGRSFSRFSVRMGGIGGMGFMGGIFLIPRISPIPSHCCHTVFPSTSALSTVSAAMGFMGSMFPIPGIFPILSHSCLIIAAAVCSGRRAARGSCARADRPL